MTAPLLTSLRSSFSEAELAGVVARLQPALGPLALLPAVELAPAEAAEAAAAFDALPADAQAAWRELVAALAAPARVAVLHYTVADETISRQFLAWPGEPSGATEIVYLARQGSQWHAGTRSPLALATLLAEVLAAGDGLRPAPLNLALSPVALLTLLAALDQLRYARLYAELMHQAPVTSFAPAEVLARLAEAEVEDFRWPLPFLEKVLPVRLPAALTAEDVKAGLVELSAAGLVEPLMEGDAAPLFALTPAGQVVADVALHDVSKLALRLSECRPGADGVGHDVLLLIRGSAQLLLFELAGESGALAALDAGRSQALWEQLLAPPDEAARLAARARADSAPSWPEVAPAPTIAGSAESKTCPQCSQPVPAGHAFCGQCGAPVAAAPRLPTCPHCGQQVPAEARFCRHCGQSLIPA